MVNQKRATLNYHVFKVTNVDMLGDLVTTDDKLSNKNDAK